MLFFFFRFSVIHFSRTMMKKYAIKHLNMFVYSTITVIFRGLLILDGSK